MNHATERPLDARGREQVRERAAVGGVGGRDGHDGAERLELAHGFGGTRRGRDLDARRARGDGRRAARALARFEAEGTETAGDEHRPVHRDTIERAPRFREALARCADRARHVTLAATPRRFSLAPVIVGLMPERLGDRLLGVDVDELDLKLGSLLSKAAPEAPYSRARDRDVFAWQGCWRER